MHGCKNVPSTTGWCEIKARAPFPHSAMLSAGRPHNGARKSAPAKKHVSFCSTLHCGGMGRGLLFRTNRSNKKRVPCFLQHFAFFGACPADAPWVSFSVFLFGPRGGWRGLLPVNPFTFSFPFGRSGWGGGGWTGANVRFNFLPRSYRICPAQPFCHLRIVVTAHRVFIAA